MAKPSAPQLYWGNIVTALRKVQEDFLAALLHGAAGRAAPHVAGSESAARRRIGIYRRNVLANLRGALYAVYPVIFRLTGEAFFNEAADRYAQAHPSRSGDLHEYGACFAGFLAQYAHAQCLPYLPDVARLEWACHEVFHAADTAPFDFTRLAAAPEAGYPELRFRLAPAVRLLEPAYPSLRIWEINQDDYRGELTVDLDSGSLPLLVRRQEYTLHIDAIAMADDIFLKGLAQGLTLEKVAELAGLPGNAEFLAQALHRHVQNGVLADFA